MHGTTRKAVHVAFTGKYVSTYRVLDEDLKERERLEGLNVDGA
jgi:hypothetical protein